MLNQTIETLEQMNDRRMIRALIDAYAHCADRRDAAGQMALFTESASLLVYFDAGAQSRARPIMAKPLLRRCSMH